jgi:hypothetical protein
MIRVRGALKKTVAPQSAKIPDLSHCNHYDD